MIIEWIIILSYLVEERSQLYGYIIYNYFKNINICTTIKLRYKNMDIEKELTLE